jgi:hypothetical protein
MLHVLVAQFTSPIVLIPVAATVLSIALGDVTDGSIILAITTEAEPQRRLVPHSSRERPRDVKECRERLKQPISRS